MAATFPNVPAYNVRVVRRGDHRRTPFGGAAIALGSASAVAIMAGTATVAAAWMVSNSLSRNPALRLAAPITLEISALPPPPQRLADASDMFGSALASANPAYAPDTREQNGAASAQEQKLASIGAAAPAIASAPAAKRVAQAVSAIPLPRSRPADHAPIKRVAEVTPAPAFAPPMTNEPATVPLPSMRAANRAPIKRVAEVTPAPAFAPPMTNEPVAVPLPSTRPADRAPTRPVSDITSALAFAPPMSNEPLTAPVQAAFVPAVTATPRQMRVDREMRIDREVASADPSFAPKAVAPVEKATPRQIRIEREVASADPSFAPKPVAPAEKATPRQIRIEREVASADPSFAPKPVAPAERVPRKPAAARLAYNNPDTPPARDSRTAIYDIVAHTVYLPDGERLEAHSGLGRFLDDPRFSSQKGRGPTPPNTYDLTLRSGLFHGVQALRLNPVADSRMYGRDGILAHTYMLGPSGQSFGCVSFKNYAEFLRAFQRGEINRLVVVPHLSDPPPAVRAQRDTANRYAFNLGRDY